MARDDYSVTSRWQCDVASWHVFSVGLKVRVYSNYKEHKGLEMNSGIGYYALNKSIRVVSLIK
jgi:hypothetical protein